MGAHITGWEILGPPNQDVERAGHSVGKEIPAERAFIVRKAVEPLYIVPYPEECQRLPVDPS